MSWRERVFAAARPIESFQAAEAPKKKPPRFCGFAGRHPGKENHTNDGRRENPVTVPFIRHMKVPSRNPDPMGKMTVRTMVLAGTMQLKRHSTTDEHGWTRMKNLFPTALLEEPNRVSSTGSREANLTLIICVYPCPSVVLNRIVPAEKRRPGSILCETRGGTKSTGNQRSRQIRLGKTAIPALHRGTTSTIRLCRSTDF